jgi:branched-chain amino acid transport system ATP-binding protein
MTSLLELRDVRVRYGQIEAVRGVSLGVPATSIVAVIGSNGAGKSTTLKSVIGLAPVAGGEIHWNGERIDRLSPAEIVSRGIALSPEGRRLFPRMTVLENLQVGAHTVRSRAAGRRTLDRIFAHFPRLHERRSQAAGSLSGGEQQMVAIGRALMAQPKLLLLDEPSLGLAPKLVREIGRIVSEIKRDSGLSIVLVEQNAQMALALSDTAYVLEQGRVVMTGAGRELLASEYVKRAYLGI